MTIQAEDETTIIPENEITDPQDGGQETDLIEQQVLHPDERELTDALKADKAVSDALAAEEAEAVKVKAAEVAAEEAKKANPEDPVKKPSPQVPVDALIATRRKGQEAETKVTERDARLAILSELADTLTPEQIRAIASGKQTIEEATSENEADPHDLLDAKELELVKQQQDGDIDQLEFTKGMQLINRERRNVDRQQASQTTVGERNQLVKESIAEASKQMAEGFPVLKTLTKADLEGLKPAAAKLTHAGMAKEFGEGVKYNDLNPQHRLFFQYNLATAADRLYGEGKGPVFQQKPNGQPSKGAPGAGAQPSAKDVIANSPAAKAAAVAAAARARNASPPDLSQFAFSADTDLGQAERIIETGTDEQVLATLAKYPELRAKLEGRT